MNHQHNPYSLNKKNFKVVTNENFGFQPFNENGKIPLGNYNDEESLKLRQIIHDSVSESTIEAWQTFSKTMRNKTWVVSDNNSSLKNNRTYPKKESDEVYENDYSDIQKSTSDTLIVPPNRIKFDNKFKLNRKIEVKPDEKNTNMVRKVEKISSNLYSNRFQPYPNFKITLTGNSKNFEHEKNSHENVPMSSSSPHPVFKSDVASREKSIDSQTSETSPGMALLKNFGFPNENKEKAENFIDECIFFKYGHCLDPETCPFLHNGIDPVVESSFRFPFQLLSYSKISKLNEWKPKDISVQLCPGYLNMECWNTNCHLRHTLYESDQIY